MKIRSGFVSNSSSSTFIAWGVDKKEIPVDDKAYLTLFDNRISTLNKQKEEDNKWYHYYVTEHNEMLEAQRQGEEAMLVYARDNLSSESFYNLGDFECGGQEGDWVAIDLSTIIKDHPEWTFGEIKTRVADLMNKTFNTNLSEEDIRFIEEAWYNG